MPKDKNKPKTKKTKTVAAVIISPIVVYRDKVNQGPKQTTLTQTYNRHTKTVAVVVVPPIAAYRDKVNQGPKQTTLTQIYNRHDSDATLSEPSDDDMKPHQKNPKFITPSETTSFTSYNPEPNSLEIGDLVMCTMAQVKHPCFNNGIIDANYLLFGIVQMYNYTGWNGMKINAAKKKKKKYLPKITRFW